MPVSREQEPRRPAVSEGSVAESHLLGAQPADLHATADVYPATRSLGRAAHRAADLLTHDEQIRAAAPRLQVMAAARTPHLRLPDLLPPSSTATVTVRRS